MKNIFLTSGIILCMATSAYATTDIAGNASTGSCIEDVLGVDDGSTQFEAKWTAKTYAAVTFACGAGASGSVTGTGTPATPTYDASFTFPGSAACTKPGYIPSQWDCGNTVGTHALSSTVTWAWDSSATCTLTWAAKNYTVTYSSTGTNCTGSYTHTNGATYGSNYSIPAAANSAITGNTGYTFNNKWRTTANGNTEFNGATPWTNDGDMTVYAYCDPNQYNVIYNKGAHNTNTNNEYTGWTHTNGATYNANYALPESDAGYVAAKTPATGYTFVGWNTESNGSGTAFTGATPWTRTSVLTVYAQYAANTHNLTYNCGANPSNGDAVGGNAPATSAGNLVYDGNITLASTAGTCALTGYTFAGWSCDYDLSNGNHTDTTYSANQTVSSIKADHDVVCTAQWSANSIRLTYSSAGGTTNGAADDGTNTWSNNSDTSCTYDTTFNLPTAPQKTGYTFDGWEVSAVSGGGAA